MNLSGLIGIYFFVGMMVFLGLLWIIVLLCKYDMKKMVVMIVMRLVVMGWLGLIWGYGVCVLIGRLIINICVVMMMMMNLVVMIYKKNGSGVVIMSGGCYCY